GSPGARPARGRPSDRDVVGSHGARCCWRFSHQGTRWDRPAGSRPSLLVFRDRARAAPLLPLDVTGARRLPRRGRSLVSGRREALSRLSPVFFHSRALPALCDAVGASAGTHLLLRRGLSRGFPAGASVLFFSAPPASADALVARESRGLFLPVLVRRYLRLLFGLFEQAPAVSHARHARRRRNRGTRGRSLLVVTPLD